MQVGIVNSVINSTAFTLAGNITFTDSDAMLGQIRGDKLSLTGQYSGPDATNINDGSLSISSRIYNSTANSTVNFSNTFGNYIIGRDSQASAVTVFNIDRPYNAIVPQFADMSSLSTNIDYYLTGITNTNVVDTTGILLTNQSETELRDKERYLKSRTSEILNNSGSYTTTITANLSTSNTKFSPYIDNLSTKATFIRNQVYKKDQTYGVILNFSNATSRFATGRDGLNVSQSNDTILISGTAHLSNSSVMYVSNVSSVYIGNGAPAIGTFQNNYSVYATANSSINAYVNFVSSYGETYNTNLPSGRSRYISKNVILADKQDAEDLKCYLTAYRPATTDFKIYGKIQHNQDSSSFGDMIWSRMVEISSPALLSSGTNMDDFVELEYDFPTSVFIASNAAQCNTSSANVTISTTAGIANGDYIYLYNSAVSNTAQTAFIVRQVNYVANNTTLVLKTIPSISTITTAYADIGVIPKLENQTAAFLFANNNNVVRYVSNTDVVYDSFKTFAIKIVPVADTAYVIPRAADMRCLALQV